MTWGAQLRNHPSYFEHLWKRLRRRKNAATRLLTFSFLLMLLMLLAMFLPLLMQMVLSLLNLFSSRLSFGYKVSFTNLGYFYLVKIRKVGLVLGQFWTRTLLPEKYIDTAL
jgi:hypothetical protein